MLESPVESSTESAFSVASASIAEVLFDQLNYLVDHTHENSDESTGCPDCARLEAVRDVLLRPFVTPPRKSAARAA